MTKRVLLLGVLMLTGCKEDGGGTTDGGVPASASACEVQELLATRCTSCHGAVPSAGAPMSLATLQALRTPAASDSTQTNAERALLRMRDAVKPMPPAPETPATQREVAVLAAWVAEGMPSCGETSSDGGTTPLPSPNLIPQDELFACTPGVVSDAPTRLRRLNRWEWTRNVGGAVTRSWTGFSFYDNPFDPSAGEQYSTWATDETLDEATVELFLPIVAEAGSPWAGPYTGSNRLEWVREDVSLRCMFHDNRPSAACVRNFVSVFLERGVLHRPPRTDEVDRLQVFATTVLSQESGTGEAIRTASIVRVSNAAWLTTGALFREELGTQEAGRAELGPWELAQQLSYAVGSRAPGATPLWTWPYYSAGPNGHLADITAAARDGSIRDDATVERLFRRNAGGTDPTRFDLVQDYNSELWRTRRGQYWLADGLSGFFREWLGYAHVASVFKERPSATSAWDDNGGPISGTSEMSFGNLMSGYYGYESTMVQQLDDLVARVVVADVDVLETLLTTRTFFLASTVNIANYENTVRYTGHPYGTEQTIADTQAARWVTLPAKERAGVLTHPAWLGAHGGNFEDDPSAIHRGKWIRENLLCDWVPPLSSVKVVAQVGPHAPDKNARRRLEEATASTACQGCHVLMNPLGLPFETYNHAGYLRRRDHAPDGGWSPPDGTSVLSGMPDPALNGPVRDAVELSEKLAGSRHVKRCFVRQAFRYYVGRPENQTDACTLNQMEQAYDANNGSFLSMVGALMKSETWKTRRVPGEAE